jgi:hypothetical protein
MPELVVASAPPEARLILKGEALAYGPNGPLPFRDTMRRKVAAGSLSLPLFDVLLLGERGRRWRDLSRAESARTLHESHAGFRVLITLGA